MNKTEKVINGLELCKENGNYCYGKQCPYEKNFPKCLQELFADALSLLKAQEPVEPLAEYSVHTGSKWVICGKCYEPLAKASDKEMPNYCPFCGRAVKWNE